MKEINGKKMCLFVNTDFVDEIDIYAVMMAITNYKCIIK